MGRWKSRHVDVRLGSMVLRCDMIDLGDTHLIASDISHVKVKKGNQGLGLLVRCRLARVPY